MGPKKQQKMSLGDFLGDQSLGSWADEMEDMPLSSESRADYGTRSFSTSMSGDRGFGGFSREQLPLPTKPPFTAHLGNLSFDATEGDIHDFFHECAVTNVRIVEDKMERKPKGFGYVEFGTLDGLKKALDLNSTHFQGRSIRISVAEPPKDRQEARDITDWTRKGPLPELSSGRRTSDRGGYRGFDNASDAGSDRGGERRRAPPFEGDGRSRDFGNWERRGPLSPMSGPATTEPGKTRGQDAPRERKMSPSWGEGRSQEGSRPPRREQERPPVDRAPTAPEMDNQWRSRMRPDPAPAKSPVTTPETSVPSSPAPTVRPKLNLAKRTVSENDPGQTPTSASSADSKPNPFGGARPIDTAAREREVEEKRQHSVQLKKEQDDKAREDKRAKETAAKTEKAASVEQDTDNADSKETQAGGDSATRKNYEILRRTADEDADVAESVEGPANGHTEDKAVKPDEPVVDPDEGSGADPTAEGLEDDGWSTVPSKSKNNRRGGNAGSRAIAS